MATTTKSIVFGRNLLDMVRAKNAQGVLRSILESLQLYSPIPRHRPVPDEPGTRR